MNCSGAQPWTMTFEEVEIKFAELHRKWEEHKEALEEYRKYYMKDPLEVLAEIKDVP